MKLYLVISDTHGDFFTAQRIIAQYSQIDGVIHLGDYLKDALILKKYFPQYEHILVPGNCDYASDFPAEKVLEAEGKKVWLTHGHNYSVKSGTGRLESKAIREGYDAVLFGHTHIPCLKRVSTLLLLNPGSLSQPRGLSGPTYALLEVSKGDIQARIMDA